MERDRLIEYLQDNFKSGDEIAFNTEGGIFLYMWEISPERVCAKTDNACGYWCSSRPGHEGDCYCAHKDVYFDPDSDDYDDDD